MSVKKNIFKNIVYGLCALPVGIFIMALWLQGQGESFGTEHIGQAFGIGFIFAVFVWPRIMEFVLFIRKGKFVRRDGDEVGMENLENFPLQAEDDLSLQQRIVYAVSSTYLLLLAYMVSCIFRDVPYNFTSAILSAFVGVMLGVVCPKAMRGLYILFSPRTIMVDPDYYSSEHDEMKEMYIVLAVMTFLSLLLLTHR